MLTKGTNIIKIWINILICFLGSIVSLSGQNSIVQTERVRDFPFARMSAIGGVHPALADDVSVLFSNPAGLNLVEEQLSVGALSVNLAGPIFDIAGIALGSNTATPANLFGQTAVQSLLSSLNAKINIGGPIAFAYVGEGLGFGAFNSTSVDFKSTGLVPTLMASITENFTVISNFSLRVPLPEESNSTLDFGFGLKTYLNGDITIRKSLIDFVTNPGLGNELLNTNPFTLDFGVGFDIGILFSHSKNFYFGLVAHDLFTPVRRNTFVNISDLWAGKKPVTLDAIVSTEVSLGVLFSPTIDDFSGILTDLKFLISYENILDDIISSDTTKHWILRSGIGIEFTLLQILQLRGGFHEGLFAAGLGLDLSFVGFNLSMYGTEESNQPGLAPIYNVDLGFDFSF